MALSTNCDSRTDTNILRSLSSLNDGTEAPAEMCTELSIFSIPPVLFTFLHVGIDECTDLYSLFLLSQTIVLSLGISKMIK